MALNHPNDGSTMVTRDSVVSKDKKVSSLYQQNHMEYNTKLIKRRVAFFAILHLFGFYGAYLFFSSAKWYTILTMIFFHVVANLGVTAGAHRLWSHRAYKATTPLKILLICMESVACQYSVYNWVRDHRVHHKFAETDADPHNATRGFLFAHIGWLCYRKHPDLKEKGKNFDLSDLKADPIIMFQDKYFAFFVNVFAVILPTAIPIYFWNESLITAFCVCFGLRWVITSHAVFLINSAAHIFGNKPYDKDIGPTENIFVSLVCVGEGWHNYHHTFPWDYKAAELGDYYNFTTGFIDLCSKIGWAYDLKTVTDEVIKNRVKRTGDGSHPIWGWGDKDMTLEERKLVEIRYKVKERGLHK